MTLDYRYITDFLFPPSEDELLVRSSTAQDFLNIQNITQQQEITTLLPYSNSLVKSAIHLLKFHNHTHARRLLGEILASYLTTTKHNNPLLIPVPLSSKRFRQRGYNQVTEVLRESVKIYSQGTLEKNILIRIRNTKAQTSLSREKRLTNLENAFGIKNHALGNLNFTERNIILIDDVTTTGATLKAARHALFQLSPKTITCIAIAH